MVQPTPDSLSAPSDPYATHLPVLQAIGAKLSIKRVLELGCGPYSTPTFLDVNVYPDLEKLVVWEDNPEYREWAVSVFADRRMIVVEALDISMLTLTADRDLIFIDNGRSKGERIEMIERVSAARPAALVIIHDFEQWEYRQVADFDWVEIHRNLPPWTAACWNGEEERFTELMP